MNSSTFRCYLVERIPDAASGQPRVTAALVARPLDELPAGAVLVRVRWSSLNYKDALAATAHPGVVKRLPHVPGIDAAGEVVESSDARFAPGSEVLITSLGIGADRWGGWAEFIRAPADWLVPLPAGLSAREAMIYGTAGYTAAQCVEALQQHGCEPGGGEVLVTGATDGVGCLAVHLLVKLGYRVAAATGKLDRREQLLGWGVCRVIGREEVAHDPDKPLLTARWAGAIDTVGGSTLATVLRETQQRGCVAACGVVGGAALPLTVYPFILRGVTLAGIDASTYPAERRPQLWHRLADEWRIADLESLTTTIGWSQLDEYVARILRGEIFGRVVVDVSAGG